MQGPTKFYREFQVEDVQRMQMMGNCVNGSEPGTGKTAVGIALMDKLENDWNLVVVPKLVLYQYQDEINAFSPKLYPMVVTGSPAARAKAYGTIFTLPRATILLTYETLRADWPLLAKFRPVETILLDEVHRLASHTTKTHKAVKSLLKAYLVYDHVPRVYGFTASLLMNSPMDIYGVFNILKPLLFPNWFRFVEEYMQRTPQGWLVGARQNKLPKLGEIIRPYYVKRTLAEVAPALPEHIDQMISFDLSAKERALYTQIKKGLIFELLESDVDKIENVFNIQNALTKMQKLQELTDSCELLGSSGIASSKLEALQEKLSELLTGNDRKCVIFTRFSRMAEIVARTISEYDPVLIMGSVDLAERVVNVKKFKTDLRCRVMIMTTAGSEGISLEEAQYLIRLDTPFSIGRDIQLTGRIRRLTSLEPTFSFTLTARDTIDEKIIAILKRKQSMNSAIFNYNDVQELLN